MTARQRVTRARLVLALVALMRVLAIAVAVSLLMILVVVAADRLLGFGRSVRTMLLPAAIVAGVAAGIRTGWGMRAIRSLERVALWLEERAPSQWALVTALDPRYAGDPVLERAATATRDRSVLWGTAMRRLLPPVGMVAVSALVLIAMPNPALLRITRPQPGDVLAGPAVTPLAAFVVEVAPPGYTGLPIQTVENPVTIAAVEGSRVRVRGRGDGVRCAVQRTTCALQREGTEWRVVLVMPDSGAVLTLSAGDATRLIALLPRRDSLPVVLLRRPERDTVLRVAEGVLPLAAGLHDDFGVRDARFEYVVSAGIGESFTFRTGVIAGTRAGREMTGVLDIRALELGAGDVVHVRAVAQDAGPAYRGLGVSSTRAIRIAREGEYDTMATVVLPALPPDTSALSQRLLIQLTEALIVRTPRLARPAVIAESRSIGRDQARLRRVVADVIFMRLGGDPEGEHAEGEAGADEGQALTPEQLLAAAEAASAEAVSGEALDFHGDETPVVAVNRPLLEAYNAMWDAGRALAVGEPVEALPHMLRALEAIQRARAAERIYLRGRPRVAVLDIDAIRLQGERGRARPVARGSMVGEREGRRVLDRLARSLGRTDSLLLLRVELLDTHPEAAAALGDAIEAVRVGRSPAGALARARAVLAGPAVNGGSRWGGW